MSRSTADPRYAERLDALERPRVARWFDVQAPYRWNIRRMSFVGSLFLYNETVLVALASE